MLLGAIALEGRKDVVDLPAVGHQNRPFLDRFQAGRSPQTSSTLVKRNQEHIGFVCKFGY